MISILLPISDCEKPELIEICLNSLSRQTHNNFEVLLVTSRKKAAKISEITKKYVFVRVLPKKLNKSAARNFAAKNAIGKYVFYIDADMQLSPRVLEECYDKAAQGAKAIVTPKYEADRPNFWSQCRKLERELYLKEEYLESPDFIQKSLFDSLGGFNEALDPLDDWNLHLSLREAGIKFGRINAPIFFRESISFRDMLLKKYQRGRLFPAFKLRHPTVPQLSSRVRFGNYLRSWKRFIKQPVIAGGLFLLKVADISSFFIGTLKPPKEKTHFNHYSLPQIAKEYDQKRLRTNFGRYKHYAEVVSLLNLLPKNPYRTRVLEVGAGTGRITRELVKKGFKITPLEPSRVMISEYKKKEGLPKPVLLKTKKYPFSDNSFPLVLSIRVFWHLKQKERERFLTEVSRTSSQSVIFDVVNKKRFLGKLLIDRDNYASILPMYKALFLNYGLKIDTAIPLDIILPVWLNLLPQNFSQSFLPLIYKIDLTLARLLPPGRYLLKLKKIT